MGLFDLKVKSNDKDVVAAINAFPANVVRPAAVDAMNWLAFDIRTAEQGEMRSVFDDPSDWTINSMTVEKATTSNPVAGVGWKKTNARTPAGKYLMPQVHGGPRPHTPFEYRLISTGKLRSDEFLVPGRFAERNRRGDMNQGQITKILSDLGTIDTAKRYPGARNQGRRSTETYYIDRKGRGEFFGHATTAAPAGIYLNKGARRRLLVFAIVRQPTYRAIFDFYGVGERYQRDNFATYFKRALDRRRTAPFKR
ncbi:MAG: hypothetical protein IKE60_34485 [Reyranella sp.]|uniref:hypothetical protein n=1 Tax=Reyranella sp. TaxID=1929291 RepID=UPI0025E8A65B|nr:hypothetical protein [Reyranella sp.]MBR2819829.1 hypothetical protein [Reyranella sp.]